MKSVIQIDKECFYCRTTQNLHSHHIFFGVSNRKNSETYGMKVWLCQEHHTGRAGVHHNRDMDLALKEMAQRDFEKLFGDRETFRKIFGKSWL